MKQWFDSRILFFLLPFSIFMWFKHDFHIEWTWDPFLRLFFLTLSKLIFFTLRGYLWLARTEFSRPASVSFNYFVQIKTMAPTNDESTTKVIKDALIFLVLAFFSLVSFMCSLSFLVFFFVSVFNIVYILLMLFIACSICIFYKAPTQKAAVHLRQCKKCMWTMAKKNGMRRLATIKK